MTLVKQCDVCQTITQIVQDGADLWVDMPMSQHCCPSCFLNFIEFTNHKSTESDRKYEPAPDPCPMCSAPLEVRYSGHGCTKCTYEFCA